MKRHWLYYSMLWMMAKMYFYASPEAQRKIANAQGCALSVAVNIASKELAELESQLAELEP